MHVSEWFHKVHHDDVSPALSLRDMSSNFLRYLGERKLKLAIHEQTFRKFMCEAVCTMYASAKQCTLWEGPHSRMPRPAGWTHQNEMAWQQYLTYMYFGSEFWTDFWHNLGEPTMWEYAIPHWRREMESILPHYVFCNPNLFLGGGGGSNIRYNYYSGDSD